MNIRRSIYPIESLKHFVLQISARRIDEISKCTASQECIHSEIQSTDDECCCWQYCVSVSTSTAKNTVSYGYSCQINYNRIRSSGRLVSCEEKLLLSCYIAHNVILSSLIAFFLEKYHNEYSDERIRNNSVSKAKISLKRICDRICSRMCAFRLSDSKHAVYRYVIRKKAKTEMLNPIQVRQFCYNRVAHKLPHLIA